MNTRSWKFLGIVAALALLFPSLAGAWPAEVARTGQTTCYYDASSNVIDCADVGQNRYMQAGVVWLDPRFIDNSDGTITDSLTGLVREQGTNVSGVMAGQTALAGQTTTSSTVPSSTTTAVCDADCCCTGICHCSDGGTAHMTNTTVNGLVCQIEFVCTVLCAVINQGTVASTEGSCSGDISTTTTTTKCDFSSDPDYERCFGGVGIQCEGIPLHPFTKNENDCTVHGIMCVGSILHDQCCVDTNNTGFHCANPTKGTTDCVDAWRQAKSDTLCGRYWDVVFGPYPAGNTGDDTSKDLRAPSGAWVSPAYQSFCQSGKCRVNKKGKTIIYGLPPCRYCLCQ